MANRGIPIIREFEGLKLRAYLCPAKVWTIGYGNTFYENGTAVREGDVITRDRADRLLFHIVAEFEQAVRRRVTSNINANQLGALTSFAFNVGIGNFAKSSLLRRVNANPNDAAIRNEFMRWTRAGGQVLRGLQRRREAEANLYFTAV